MLLFHHSLGTRERRAAYAGTKTFERIGVICDCLGLEPNSKWVENSLMQVKVGEKISSIVNAENPVISRSDLVQKPWWTFIFPRRMNGPDIAARSIYGLGITPNPLNPETGGTESDNEVVLSGVGGVLSIHSFFRYRLSDGEMFRRQVAWMQDELNGLFGIRFSGKLSISHPFCGYKRPENGLFDAAIGAAVQHKLGHIFGISQHCTDETCIMQADNGYPDFMERFVKPALDFCGRCQERIGIAVEALMRQTC
jgi:hypothetical protein